LSSDGLLVRAKGYTFALDTATNQYIKQPDIRVRIFGVGDSGIIVNVLPPTANLSEAKYTYDQNMRLVVTDGKNFSLDINEFGSNK
jgi:hypothetical protein